MWRDVYRAADLPVLQNRTFADVASAKAAPCGEVRLVQDMTTGLIFNAAFDPSVFAYDINYQNEQAYSPRFRAHLLAVEGIIARHFTGQLLLEVGCGKGYFLELLKEHGYQVTGIDPAYEGANPNVIRQPFTRDLGIRADALILRHVLEHIQHPVMFLQAMADANQGGRIYIEVPCLDWIVEQRAWFDVFYEHVNYFRLQDLCGLFGSVLESGHLFGGQYLYVVADLSTLLTQRTTPSEQISWPSDFTASLQRTVQVISENPDKQAVIWGASSKGVIYGLSLQRAGIDIDYVVDINPDKQGRYLPLSGLQVSSVQRVLDELADGANVFVMNSNYLEEIEQLTQGRFVCHAVDTAAFRLNRESDMSQHSINAFEAECQEQIIAQSQDPKVTALARDFFDESARYKYSYHFSWMGRPIIQLPQDMMAMQELVWRIKPDLIIECGIAHGGSILYYSSLLELQGHGEVLGIDLDIRAHNRAAIEGHPMFKRVRMLEGSSIDPQIVEQVYAAAAGKKVIVVLDSNHTHDHVFAELQAYAPLVAVGSYCVVMDTVVEDMPHDAFPDRPWGPGNNPKTAVWAYLKENPAFEVDYQIQNKLMITVAPDGYLRRVR